MLFRDEQIALLAASGWSQCDSIAAALADAGLPPVTTRYLGDMFSAEQWKTAEAMTVAPADWGARVLQRGPNLPDCEANDRWTFTLFAGEKLIDGCAASGTVLKGRVRFRLGKPTRGIGSARIAPAIAIP
jgi:hypothetical protein